MPTNNQSSITLTPGISGWQKRFLKDLRDRLVSTVEKIEAAEEDGDESEIGFQLYSLFVQFDEEYRSFHEAGARFGDIRRENFLQAARRSLALSTFLGNVLVMMAQILDGALKSRDYSHVLREFDSQIAGLIH